MNAADLIARHTAALLEAPAELAHYGVPGMKWGVRKRRRAAAAASQGPVEPTVQRRPGGSINLKKTQGGQGFEPSQDARVAARNAIVAKRSGVAALSNQELKQLVDRMNLEMNYSKAMAARQPTKGPMRKILDDLVSKEKDAVFSGKKPKSVEIVETAIDLNKKRKAARAAGKTGRAVLKAIAARS